MGYLENRNNVFEHKNIFEVKQILLANFKCNCAKKETFSNCLLKAETLFANMFQSLLDSLHKLPNA